MTTALDLITGAAKLIGVTFKSEALSADEAADGLVSLNDMLASWSNNGLLCVSRVKESFSVASATSYTIGTSQTLNTTRPIDIVSATFTLSSIDNPLKRITDEEYEDIRLKAVPGGVPRFFSYDNAYSTGAIRLYPQSAGTLNLLSEKPITNFPLVSTAATLAPGWNRAIRFNLAIEMAPEYGQEVPASVLKGAADSLADIELAIAKNRPIKFKRPVVTKGSIYNDGYP